MFETVGGFRAQQNFKTVKWGVVMSFSARVLLEALEACFKNQIFVYFPQLFSKDNY